MHDKLNKMWLLGSKISIIGFISVIAICGMIGIYQERDYLLLLSMRRVVYVFFILYVILYVGALLFQITLSWIILHKKIQLKYLVCHLFTPVFLILAVFARDNIGDFVGILLTTFLILLGFMCGIKFALYCLDNIGPK